MGREREKKNVHPSAASATLDGGKDHAVCVHRVGCLHRGVAHAVRRLAQQHAGQESAETARVAGRAVHETGLPLGAGSGAHSTRRSAGSGTALHRGSRCVVLLVIRLLLLLLWLWLRLRLLLMVLLLVSIWICVLRVLGLGLRLGLLLMMLLLLMLLLLLLLRNAVLGHNVLLRRVCLGVLWRRAAILLRGAGLLWREGRRLARRRRAVLGRCLVVHCEG